MKINEFMLERYFAKYEFSTPYLLSSSDCESISIKELLSMEDNANENFLSLNLGYTESTGSLGLREEIASLYDNISSEDVLVFSGAEEGIFTFMNSCLSKGDHVIVQYPSYQSLYEVARSTGCEVSFWNVFENNGKWDCSIEELKKMIKPTTKAIVVNNSHNPTGYLMTREKYDKLIELANESGILLFSDEVYRYLEYEKSSMLPAAADSFERAISLGVMSKSFGLAGLRIGWIATRDKKIFDKLATFKDYTTICCSAPSEFLAEVAIRNRESIVKRNYKLIKNNLSKLEKFFSNHTDIFEWTAPDAGPIAFPKYCGELSIEDFCEKIAKEAGVLLLPGSVFGINDSKRFRVGFGRKDISPALDALDTWILHNTK